MRCPLFGNLSGYEVFQGYLSEIQSEIDSKPNDYILNVSVSEWREYFVNKYDFIPLSVYPDKAIIVSEGKRITKKDNRFGGFFNIEEYKFRIEVPFTGSSFLFSLKPSTSYIDYPFVETSDEEHGMVSYLFTLSGQDENLFLREKARFVNLLNQNTPNVNNDLEKFKLQVPTTFDTYFGLKKNKVSAEAIFYEKLNIKINTDKDRIYKVPVVQKKVIREPVVDKKTARFSTYTPTVDDKGYDAVLETIYNFYKSVEKKPSTYNNLDEEGLRDYVLPVLEPQFNNTTVTGETFNKAGKTDILIKYKDGTNLFIAECKIWKGESVLKETINQLFDRYLTWRDSKVAIIFFVKNKEFSKILEVLKLAIPKHLYFVSIQGTRGESSFSYIFHFPMDIGKHIYLEVMAFHFP